MGEMFNLLQVWRWRWWATEESGRDGRRAESHYPDDTIVQFNYLPTIYAQMTLDDRDPAQAWNS